MVFEARGNMSEIDLFHAEPAAGRYNLARKPVQSVPWSKPETVCQAAQ